MIMKTKQITIIFTGMIVMLGFTVQAYAQKLSARDIIEKVYNRPTGDDMTSSLTMTLINKSGSKRVRKIKQFQRDFGEVEKKIIFFVAPADVKNTSFMNWSYDDPGKSDDQWIYLPAIKRVKRISSDSKSDYFMGSDFTYDDLGDRKVDDDTHTLLREETIDGVKYWVIKSVPKDPDYMYSKTVVWIRQDNFIGLKKEFYDEDGELLKTLKIEKFEKINGFDIITRSVMENVQKNHKTIMEMSNISINTGIPESKFTTRMMMRGI